MRSLSPSFSPGQSSVMPSTNEAPARSVVRVPANASTTSTLGWCVLALSYAWLGLLPLDIHGDLSLRTYLHVRVPKCAELLSPRCEVRPRAASAMVPLFSTHGHAWCPRAAPKRPCTQCSPGWVHCPTPLRLGRAAGFIFPALYMTLVSLSSGARCPSNQPIIHHFIHGALPA